MIFQKNIQFTDADGQTVFVEIQVKDGGKLSMVGHVNGGGGQCQDQIKPANAAQKELIEIWDRWHLNDLKAGTARQLAAVKDIRDYSQQCEKLQTIDRATGRELSAFEWQQGAKLLKRIEDYPRDGFTSAAALSMDFQVSFNKEERARIENGHGKEVLKAKVLGWSLLYDEHPQTRELFQFGAVWITEPLPADICERLENLCAQIGGEFTGSPYEKQANDFLKSHNITFSAKFAGHGKHFPDDDKPRAQFWCTFTDENRHSFRVKFGQSHANGEKYPTAYDVLACLTKSDPGTLENFCSEMGYDLDSKKAERIYNSVREEWENVFNFFTDEQLTELQNIG